MIPQFSLSMKIDCASCSSVTRPLAIMITLCHTTFVVEEISTLTSHPTTMNLSKSFPPVDALIETLQQVNYQKLLKDTVSFVITAAALVAVIATLIWEKVQVMKFQTPTIMTEYFYFGVNFNGNAGDELVGLSVGNRYVGLYSNGISWGVLDNNAAL